MPSIEPTTTTKPRKNAAETKARILAAAQKCFAASGYSSVGVREIAAEAGVNNTLIARYFGSKAELFEAALISAIDFASLGRIDKQSFAKSMLGGVTAQNLEGTAMALRSVGDAEMRAIIEKVTNDRVIPRMVELLGPPHAEERALNIVILTTGYLLSTRMSPVGVGDNQITREWVLQSLELLIAGREPGQPANSD